MRKLIAECVRRRKSHENDQWSGGPATVITKKNIDNVHQFLIDDRRFTIQQIANAISVISGESGEYSARRFSPDKKFYEEIFTPTDTWTKAKRMFK